MVLSGDAIVGTIKFVDQGPRQWQWSVTALLGDRKQFQLHGSAPTRETAQEAFSAAWRAYVADAGLQEVLEAKVAPRPPLPPAGAVAPVSERGPGASAKRDD